MQFVGDAVMAVFGALVALADHPARALAKAAVALAIVATIAHTLLGFFRQRRRDNAVLKALGFTRGQVRTTVLTQSAVILAVAFMAGLPLGIAAGRWRWTPRRSSRASGPDRRHVRLVHRETR